MGEASTESAQGLSLRDKVLVSIVPLVLVAIALTAIVRYHRLEQSSWQGVGFGMFATYDNRVSRFTRVEVDGEVRNPRPRYSDLVDRGEVTPLGPAPAELARSVKRQTDAREVVVEVWGVDVDPGDGSLVVSARPIRRVVVR